MQKQMQGHKLPKGARDKAFQEEHIKCKDIINQEVFQ